MNYFPYGENQAKSNFFTNTYTVASLVMLQLKYGGITASCRQSGFSFHYFLYETNNFCFA